MADADEAPVTEDNSVPEPVVQDDDVSLEDIEVTEAELDGAEVTEEIEKELESEATPTESESQDEELVEESEQSDETEEDTTPGEEAETEKTQKQLAHEAFKRREAERKLRDEREQREKENLDRYLEEAQDDEVELAKRQTEVDRHLIQKERISINADKLDVGIRRFAAENELLKTGDSVVQEAIAEALDDFEAMYVVKDKQGNPLEVKADVYQYLQKKADSIQKLTGIGARQQTKQKANEKMRTVTRPTRTPKEPTVDKDVQDFEDAFN